MKRPDAGSATSAPGEFPDKSWRESYPNLCGYLCDDKWEDGKDRDLSTVTIKFQEGHVLAVLNDVDVRRSLYVTGDTVTQAIKALEKQLGAPGADWRSWGGNKKKK